jgi:hypothetical protein
LTISLTTLAARDIARKYFNIDTPKVMDLGFDIIAPSRLA